MASTKAGSSHRGGSRREGGRYARCCRLSRKRPRHKLVLVDKIRVDLINKNYIEFMKAYVAPSYDLFGYGAHFHCISGGKWSRGDAQLLALVLGLATSVASGTPCFFCLNESLLLSLVNWHMIFFARSALTMVGYFSRGLIPS